MDLQTPTPIAINVDFTVNGNLGQLQHYGFSVPEPAGTWAIGKESVIILDPVGMTGPIGLEMFVQGFVQAGLIEQQAMTVQVNGVLIGSAAILNRDWTDLTFQIPAHALEPWRPIRITITHDTPVAPAQTGQSPDTRLLSFMFRSLTLSGVEAAGAEIALPASSEPSVSPPSPDMSGEVHRGRDGWLFLTGGSNAVLRYYQDPSYFDDAQCTRWADLLTGRQARLSQLGIRYLHIAAPDKISVYPELLSLTLPNLARHPIAMLAAELRRRGQDGLLINPLVVFRNHPDRARLYLKTDTHWTYRAGQLVLEMVAQRLGQIRRLTLHGRNMTYYTHVWDLGSKVEPTIPEQNYAVVTSRFVSRTHENELARSFQDNVRHGRPVTHGSIYVSFRNTDPAALAEVVVIFGDSFMDFQESNTSIIFAETFREVHFVWSPNIDFDFVQKVGATLVITELAERFMISMPDDQYQVVL
jgi:hypothetical protein